jgi:hypothetical protein
LPETLKIDIEILRKQVMICKMRLISQIVQDYFGYAYKNKAIIHTFGRILRIIFMERQTKTDKKLVPDML